METKSENYQVSPVAILAGIRSLDRRSLCAMIAMLETGGMISIAAESIRGTAKKLGAEIKEMADAANEAASRTGVGSTSSIGRHRWP